MVDDDLGPGQGISGVSATEADSDTTSFAILQRLKALEAVKQTTSTGTPQPRFEDLVGRIVAIESRIDVLNTWDLERRISALEAEEIRRREESLVDLLSGCAKRAETRPEQPLSVQESSRRNTSDVVSALRQLKDEGLAALAKRRFDPFLGPPDTSSGTAQQERFGDDLNDSRMINALEVEEVQTMVARTRESLAEKASRSTTPRECMIQLNPHDLAVVTRPIRESMEQNFLALQAEFAEKLRQATGLISTHMETVINEKLQSDRHRHRADREAADSKDSASPEDDVSALQHARLASSTASSSSATSACSSIASLPRRPAPATGVTGRQKLKDPSLASRLMLDLSRVRQQPPDEPVTHPQEQRPSGQRPSGQESGPSGLSQRRAESSHATNLSLPPVWEPFAPSPRQFEEPLRGGLTPRPKEEATVADAALRNLLAGSLPTDSSLNTRRWARLDLLWPMEDGPATSGDAPHGVGATQHQTGGPVVMTF